jgi:hypothetical protein
MDTNERVAALAARFAKGKELFCEGDAPPDDEEVKAPTPSPSANGNGKHEPRAVRRAETPEIRLLLDAQKLLRRMGLDAPGLHVRVQSGDGLCYHEMHAPTAPEYDCPPPDEGPPEGGAAWLWLSPAEEAVVRALRGRNEWVTSNALAESADRELDAGFKGVLRNLVDRGVLRSSQGRGYRLCE